MTAIMSNLLAALETLPSEVRRLRAGELLFRAGDRVRHLYLVQRGCIHLRRYGEGGELAVMQRASTGSLVAEASIFATVYHCDAVAVADSQVLRLLRRDLEAACARDSRVMEAVARHLAGEVHRARSRVEVLSKKTVRERLDAWLALGGEWPERGGMAAVAEDIGVSPEAFYREMQRRRGERNSAKSP